MVLKYGILYKGEMQGIQPERGRSVFKMLTDKPPGKRPVSRPRRKMLDWISKEMGIDFDSAQDEDCRITNVSAELKLRVS